MTISTVSDWQATYATADQRPDAALHRLRDTLAPDDPAWIHIVSAETLDTQLSALAQRLAAAGGETAAPASLRRAVRGQGQY